MVTIRKAHKEDIDTIVSFLGNMQDELEEFIFDPIVAKQSILRGLNEGVHWFLFQDKGSNKDFGLCQLQSVHRYWSLQKRFYLGGFYIVPDYRKKGHFKDLYKQLKQWTIDNHGVQLYSHIHKNNDKSLGAFGSAGMKDEGYLLMVDHWG